MSRPAIDLTAQVATRKQAHQNEQKEHFMATDQAEIEIMVDGSETAQTNQNQDPTKVDSLEAVRADLNGLTARVDGNGKTLEETAKGIGELNQEVAKLRDRLDTWETNGQKRRELIKRLMGMEVPSNATSQQRSTP